MEGNLTKGPILKTLTKLAIPIMASSFLGTLYNITDMAWIGSAGLKSSCRSWCRRYVYMAFAGTCSYGEDGRDRCRWQQCIGRGERDRAHGFAQAAVQLATLMGMGIRGYFACVYTADGCIFSVDGIRRHRPQPYPTPRLHAD